MSKTELEILEEKKIELINDLAAIATVMDEIWKYHPDNPKKVDIIVEYESLKSLQADIEREINELGI
jgi:hypothetical protein